MSEKRNLNDKEQAIAKWAQAQIGHGYTWGATGQILTQGALNALIAKHKQHIDEAIVRKWLGKRVYDCAS